MPSIASVPMRLRRHVDDGGKGSVDRKKAVIKMFQKTVFSKLLRGVADFFCWSVNKLHGSVDKGDGFHELLDSSLFRCVLGTRVGGYIILGFQ